MRSRVNVLCFLGLAGAALAVQPAVAQTPEPVGFLTEPAAASPRVYGGAEYLLWWVKSAPLRTPLVVTGGEDEEDAGVSPFATILYGGSSQGFQAASGVRLTLGSWLDNDQTLSVEGRGFVLERRTAGFAVHSDANGSPQIQVPFFDTGPGFGENGFSFSLPDVLAGGVKITNSLRLWGADATTVVNLHRDATWELSGLVGFTYLDLYENFELVGDLTGVVSPFLGQSGTLLDHFQTRNQFYGGTVGMRAAYRLGAFALEGASRLSLGCSHEVVTVAGGFQAVNYFNTSGPEGIFAQPSNEGRRTRNDFAVVPEVQLKLCYNLASWMRLSVGYNFLYDSNVVRPGDQIDRNVPKGQTFYQGQAFGQPLSLTTPGPQFNRTDFFAHGVTFGLEFWF